MAWWLQHPVRSRLSSGPEQADMLAGWRRSTIQVEATLSSYTYFQRLESFEDGLRVMPVSEQLARRLDDSLVESFDPKELHIGTAHCGRLAPHGLDVPHGLGAEVVYLDCCHGASVGATAWIWYLYDVAFVHRGVDGKEVGLGLDVSFDCQSTFVAGALAVDDLHPLGTH